MSTELILQYTNTSGPIVPSKVAIALVKTTPRAVVHGQELRLALVLPLKSAACAAFLLDFAGQGQRVKGVAHGPSTALLTWAFHTVAASLKCTLFDADLGHDVEPDPAAHLDAAVAYLSSYEADLLASRKDGDDGAALLAWLAREEHIALADDESSALVASEARGENKDALVASEASGGANKRDALGAALPMDDAAALYEMLLESDAVEDVFVSERELASLLARFKARLSHIMTE